MKSNASMLRRIALVIASLLVMWWSLSPSALSSAPVAVVEFLPSDSSFGGLHRSSAEATVKKQAVLHPPDAVAELQGPFLVPMMLAVVPIVSLSHTDFERLSLSAQTWVDHLLLTQKTIHLAICFDPSEYSTERLVQFLGLEVLNATHYSFPRPHRFPIALVPVDFFSLAPDDVSAGSNGLQKVDDNDCGVKVGGKRWRRSAVERWMTLDVFAHPLVMRYKFLLRLHHTTWYFRRPRFPVVGTLLARETLMATVGGLSPVAADACPPQPHASSYMALLQNSTSLPSHTSARGDSLLEDRWVIVATDSFAEGSAVRQVWEPLLGRSTKHQAVALFHQHSWRAVDLWHLMLRRTAAVAGRSDVIVDYQWMLWKRRALRRDAVMYFSSHKLEIDELKHWTRLRWSRYPPVNANF